MIKTLDGKIALVTGEARVLGQQLPKVLLKREPMSPSLITAIKKGLNLSWQK